MSIRNIMMTAWVSVQLWKLLRLKLSRMGFIWCFKPCELHVMYFVFGQVTICLSKFRVIMWWVFIIIQLI